MCWCFGASCSRAHLVVEWDLSTASETEVLPAFCAITKDRQLPLHFNPCLARTPFQTRVLSSSLSGPQKSFPGPRANALVIVAMFLTHSEVRGGRPVVLSCIVCPQGGQRKLCLDWLVPGICRDSFGEWDNQHLPYLRPQSPELSLLGCFTGTDGLVSHFQGLTVGYVLSEMCNWKALQPLESQLLQARTSLPTSVMGSGLASLYPSPHHPFYMVC